MGWDEMEDDDKADELAEVHRLMDAAERRDWPKQGAERIAEIRNILRNSRPQCEVCPTDDACQRLAMAVAVLRHTKETQGGVDCLYSLLDVACRFLMELEDFIDIGTRYGLEGRIPFFQQMTRAHASTKEMVEACANDVRDRALTPEFCAMLLLEILKDSWRQVGIHGPMGISGPGRKRSAKGQKAKADPLCKEVTEMLNLIGMHYAEDTVSDMLRVVSGESGGGGICRSRRRRSGRVGRKHT